MIKATGGGRFEALEEPIYFAAGNNIELIADIHPWSLMAVNDMGGKGGIDNLEYRLQIGNKVMLDSGIFWLTNRHKRAHKGMTMDEALSLAPDQIDGFEDLFDAYVGLVRRFEDRLWGYVELDQGGAVNKRKTRALLEGMGLTPMPVYHPLNDGWDYFDELCEGYDRICVGNIVQADMTTRKHLMATLWERHRRYPHVWIHALGMTPNELITVYPTNSCDSASYTYSVKYGAESVPFSLSMLDAFGRLPKSYSYQTGNDDGGKGRDKGLEFLASNAVFLVAVWRRQLADVAELFDHPWLPPADDREGVRR